MAGIYLHIPFCKQACNYCNFHFSTSLTQKENLLQALQKEIALQKDYLGNKTVETIYFGGGTPSLLSGDELKIIFGTIENYFPRQDLLEVTLEANPDDINPRFLKVLKSTPVNRLSIGVQSFREDDLRFMHRAHNAQQADYAIKAAQDAGFENMSIDLIYGSPGLSDDYWKENISKAQQLLIPHISSYALTVEPRTALAHAIEKGTIREVDAMQAATQFELLMGEMQCGGYEHYEISNFALPGKYAVHNTNYWKGKHYLGIGPSAHSYNGLSRRWNIANNSLYINSILSEGKCNDETELLTETNRINEYIMTSLRTMWGLSLDYVTNNFGSGIAEEISKQVIVFIDKKQMTMQDNTLYLTRSGKLFADAIAAELFFTES